MQPGDVLVTYADITPLEQDFGFKPSTPLREGLRRFAEWYSYFCNYNSVNEMQKFVSQPSDSRNGKYEVARWNELKGCYQVISREMSKDDAVKLAHDFNVEYQKEIQCIRK